MISYLNKIKRVGEAKIAENSKPFKRIALSPFVERKNKKLIIHCCHHKVGTGWFSNILKKIADTYGLNFLLGAQSDLNSSTDIWFQHHSQIDTSVLPPYRGSHMIRDPRDIIISAYFYHLWTNEKWAQIPKEEFGNISYQQYLNSLNQEEGIMAEIKRSSSDIKEMVAWDYNNPCFYEIKYEDIIANEESIFSKLFYHYGFNKKTISISLDIAKTFSFENIAGRKIGQVKNKTHLRSGMPGEYKKYFTEKHKTMFKKILGGAVVKLGYESSDDW